MIKGLFNIPLDILLLVLCHHPTLSLKHLVADIMSQDGLAGDISPAATAASAPAGRLPGREGERGQARAGAGREPGRGERGGNL